MPKVRRAVASDLDAMIELFQHAPVSLVVTPIEPAREIWQQTLAQDGVDVLVSEEDERIVSTCMLITVPNLLRGGHEHGFIENVVTHDDYRRRGHGTAVIQAALELARAQGCFHVMLQTGRQDPGVHQFYERQGFTSENRVAYTVRYPET